MAKWEIIEDNKFKKQTGGKAATRTISDNRANRAASNSKPVVIQKPNLAPYYVPAQDATYKNQPIIDKLKAQGIEINLKPKLLNNSVIASIPVSTNIDKPVYTSKADYKNKRYGAPSVIPQFGQSIQVANFEGDKQPFYEDVATNEYKAYSKDYSKDYEQEKINDKVSQFLKANPIPKTNKEKANYIENLSPYDRQLIQSSSSSNEFLPAFRQYDNQIGEDAKKYTTADLLSDPTKFSEVTKAGLNRFRFFPNATNSIEDFVNPGLWFGQMEQGLGDIPKNIKEENYLAATMGVVNPLLMGRAVGSGSINPLGKSFWTNEVSNAQFINNLVNPLAGIVDANTVKGLGNKAVDKYIGSSFTPVLDNVGVEALGAGKQNITSSVGNVENKFIPKTWQMQDLSGLHLQSTMDNGAISKIIEPKTGLINTEQALAIIGKESSGADKVALIKQGLGKYIPKKMDYNDFRKVVQDQLIPLETNLVDHSSEYGLERLGYDSGKITTTEVNGNKIHTMQPDYIENQTIVLSNKNKFGRGSSAHGNPDETLGHIHYLIDAETPDILTATQIQSDAFQSTYKIMPKAGSKIPPLEKMQFSFERLVKKLERDKSVLNKMKTEGVDEGGNLVQDYQIKQFEDIVKQQEQNTKFAKADLENFSQKQLLDKNHQERYLQELVNYAGNRGDLNKVRVPTSETAAKVQGYTSKKNWNVNIKEGDEVTLLDGTKGKITDDTFINSTKITTFDGQKIKVDFTQPGFKKSKTLPVKSVNNTELKEVTSFMPEHQTILKKYSEQPKTIKKLFGQDAKIVTDSKSNTWYEFDIPKSFKEGKGQIKAFSLGGMASIGIGAASALQQKKHGGIIEDPMGQWAHPGSVTRIPSNQITMQGVNYPVLGISDKGHTQMMYPGEDYSFRGKSVTEYPMMQGGGQTLLRNQILNTKLPATNQPTLNPNLNRSTFTTSPLSLQALGEQDYGVSLNKNGLNLSAGLNLEGKNPAFRAGVDYGTGRFSGGLNYGYNQEGDRAHNFGANANLGLGKNLNLSADANFDSNKNYQVNAGLKYNFQDGGEVNFTYAGENHRVYKKESPTGNGKGIEGHIMVNHPTENKGKWDTIDLTKITNGKVKTVAQGVASTKKWHKENPEYATGGKVSSWEIIEDLPKAQNGKFTNPPIYVNDPNDPRLQMYNDSLNLNKAYLFQKNHSERSDSDYDAKFDSAKKGTTRTNTNSYYDEIQKSKKLNFNSFAEYQKANDDFDKFTTNPDWYKLIKTEPYKSKYAWTDQAAGFKNTEDFKKLGIKGDYDKIKYYESLNFSHPEDVAIGRYSSADIAYKRIKPIGSYWGGKGYNPIYAAPKQPYILTSAPFSTPSIHSPGTVSYLTPTFKTIPNLAQKQQDEIIPFNKMGLDNLGPLHSMQKVPEPNPITSVPKDYVTITTGSSYRNPETGAFEQKTFKIDKKTGKTLTEPVFKTNNIKIVPGGYKNGGKTKKSNWQIIEY